MNAFRYAARILVKSPGFTAVAVATLALGIGANTAVFSLLRAAFFAPLPLHDADRVVVVTERRSSSGDANLPISAHEFMAWQQQNRSLAAIALMQYDGANLTGGGDPEKLQIVRVSADYFQLLGIVPARGRAFVAGEDGGGGRLVVLSDRLWRQRFGADEAIVGRTVTLNDQAHEVVGVLAPLPDSLTADAWLPIDLPGNARAVGRHNLNVVARLREGVSIDRAREDLAAVSAQLARDLPRDNTGHDVWLTPLREALVGEYAPALLTLLGAAAFVLLIACANVMNLLLTRGAGRQKELAIRSALGATRRRLVRDLLAESLLVGVAGGAAGLLVAAWIVDLVPAMQALDIPLLDTARLDWQALTIAGVMALGTGVGAGLAPALRGARQPLARLREGDRTSDDAGRRRLRSLLVSAETALAFVLLAGAGLMINSFVRLTSVDPGFRTEGVLVVPVNLPGARYPDAVAQRAFYDRALASIREVPGVEAAGAVSHLPLGGADNWMMFSVAGRPPAEPGNELTAPFRTASPDYFRALGIPLVRGRIFADSDARLSVPLVRWYPQQPAPPDFDTPQAPPVLIISEAAAQRFFPNEDPIGRRLRVMFSPVATIVGVVGNVRHNGLNLPAYHHIYLPHSQEVWNSASLVVKTAAAAPAGAAEVRARVAALDPALPVAIRWMDDVRSASVGQPRLYALLVACFAAVAVGLAVVGIFGVVSHTVVQRTREIGVRVALGAEEREIRRLVVSQGMRPVALGLAAGVVGALALTRSMETLLFEVEPADPLTFAIVVALLGGIALAACWLPARRAARLDPVVALRAE
jgi:putative ABC transport system permease protein